MSERHRFETDMLLLLAITAALVAGAMYIIKVADECMEECHPYQGKLIRGEKYQCICAGDPSK